MATEDKLKEIKAALSTPTPHTVIRELDEAGTRLSLTTEYAHDYEGKLITRSEVKATREWSFTSEGPRVNSDSMDNDLDELLANDPDWIKLLGDDEE